MVSIKNLSVATASLILSFPSKALGDVSETTTDFVVCAEGAESGVSGEFTLRSAREDLLTRSDGTLVDMEARDFEDEVEERDVDDLEERAPIDIPPPPKHIPPHRQKGRGRRSVDDLEERAPINIPPPPKHIPAHRRKGNGRRRSIDEYLEARAPRRRRGGRRHRQGQDE